MGFPVWIIAVVVAILVVLFSLICYFILTRRRRTASTAVDVVDTAEKAIGTATITSHHHQQETVPLSSPSPHAAPKDTVSMNGPLSSPSQVEPSTSATSATSTTNDNVSLPPSRKSSRKQQQDSNKINLPLPPPSTSLFSDKMELSSDEAMEIFDKYVHVELEKSSTATGGFTANIQQKAATLRSTMRQSLRRQKSTNKPTTPLQTLFDSSGSGSETTSTTGSTPSLVEKHPVPSIRTVNNDRTITPGIKTPTTPSTPISRAVPRTLIPATDDDDDNNNDGDDDDCVDNNYNDSMPEQAAVSTEPPPPASPPAVANGAAMNAARRVIRTASRKSKTRSMLVNEDDVLKMFNPEAAAVAAATATKTGSVRRLVRDSIVNEKSASMRARGSNGAAGTSVRHLAERWNNHAMPAAAATVAGRVQQRVPRASAQDLFESRKTTQQQQQEDNTSGNVDNVRKMLQATWQANLRESGSMVSIVSTTEAAVAAGSNHHNSNTLRQNPILRNSTQTILQDVASRTATPSSPSPVEPETAVSSPASQEKIEIEGTSFAMVGYNYQTWNVGRRSTASKTICSVFQSGHDADDLFSTVGRRQSNRQRRVSPWTEDMVTNSNTTKGSKTPAQLERDDYRTAYQLNRA